MDWLARTIATEMEAFHPSSDPAATHVSPAKSLSMRLPAVVTVDLRLNTPRFVSLPNAIKCACVRDCACVHAREKGLGV